jgi:hypothetical protein
MKDGVMAKIAFGQINTAYKTMQSGGHGPFADFYKAQLAEARSILERLSTR